MTHKTEIRFENLEPSAFDGKLRERINEIIKKVQEVQERSLTHSVNIDKWEWDGKEEAGASISIKPRTSFYNEGEKGFDRMFIILGPRGGVHHSEKSNIYGRTKYDEESQPFKKTLKAIDFMM